MDKDRIVEVIGVGFQVAVTVEDIEDMMVTALEGGIGYWACLDNSGAEFSNAPDDETISETAARLLLEGKSITLIDEEEGERHELTLKKLLAGFKKWFRDGYDCYDVVTSDGLDMCNFDAECADGVIQTAIFGEIIYG